jgi:hypothetical protein
MSAPVRNAVRSFLIDITLPFEPAAGRPRLSGAVRGLEPVGSRRRVPA